MFEIPMPGLFVVRYRAAADLDPERQGALLDAVRTASRAHPITVVFVIGEAVRLVDFAVPAFWLRTLGDPALRIGAMAMVTTSKAVQIAAQSFGAANRYRRSALEVRTFVDERSALAWARGVATYAAAASTP